MRVRVYRNLTKGCWSVMNPKTGLVIDHADRLILQDCTFKVREGGRQRVLREKRKNVHAFVEGEAVDDFPKVYDQLVKIGYNPYLAGTFYRRDTDAPVHKAEAVLLDQFGVLAGGVE